MGLYGVTMIGADICGFGGDTTAELCARWIQLGSLYPFARDHSSIGTRDQEAYRFGEPYTSLNRNSIKLRYSLLPYLYQLFVDSHLSGSATHARLKLQLAPSCRHVSLALSLTHSTALSLYVYSYLSLSSLVVP